MPNYQYSLIQTSSDVPNCKFIVLGVSTVDATVEPLELIHSPDSTIVSFSNFIYMFNCLLVSMESAPSTTIGGLDFEALETGQSYAVMLILGE